MPLRRVTTDYGALIKPSTNINSRRVLWPFKVIRNNSTLLQNYEWSQKGEYLSVYEYWAACINLNYELRRPADTEAMQTTTTLCASSTSLDVWRPLSATERFLLQPLVCGTVFHHTSLLLPLPSLDLLLSYPAFWLFSHFTDRQTDGQTDDINHIMMPIAILCSSTIG